MKDCVKLSAFETIGPGPMNLGTGRWEVCVMDKYLITYEYKKRNGNSFLITGIKTEILTMSQLKQKTNDYKDDGEYLKVIFCQKL